jgi:hypothetical protein
LCQIKQSVHGIFYQLPSINQLVYFFAWLTLMILITYPISIIYFYYTKLPKLNTISYVTSVLHPVRDSISLYELNNVTQIEPRWCNFKACRNIFFVNDNAIKVNGILQIVTKHANINKWCTRRSHVIKQTTHSFWNYDRTACRGFESNWDNQ